jgi:hypothetical protein
MKKYRVQLYGRYSESKGSNLSHGLTFRFVGGEQEVLPTKQKNIREKIEGLVCMLSHSDSRVAMSKIF